MGNGLRSESVSLFTLVFPGSILQALLVRGLESPFVPHSLPPNTIKGPVYLANFLERDDGFLPYCLKSIKDIDQEKMIVLGPRNADDLKKIPVRAPPSLMKL